MTKDELLVILNTYDEEKNGDFETGHAQADAALIAFINDPEIAEAYDRVGRWYA